MNVIFLKKVRKQFESLVPVLYENGYFSFLEDAQKYVDELFEDITENLPNRSHRPAPPYFDKYGKSMKYAASTVSRALSLNSPIVMAL